MEIKHKTTGKVLLEVKGDTLSEADLRGADLSWADLRWAKGTFIFNWGVKLRIVK